MAQKIGRKKKQHKIYTKFTQTGTENWAEKKQHKIDTFSNRNKLLVIDEGAYEHSVQ